MISDDAIIGSRTLEFSIVGIVTSPRLHTRFLPERLQLVSGPLPCRSVLRRHG